MKCLSGPFPAERYICLVKLMPSWFRCFGRHHLPIGQGLFRRVLNFDHSTLNSMDSVADRDYLLEPLSALSIIMMHLSRFSEEIIIWNSNEYQFIELTMLIPQEAVLCLRKNPDIAELVRGKTGRVYGPFISTSYHNEGTSFGI